MATLNTSRGSSTSDVTMEDRAGVQPAYGQQPIGPEAKKAAVHEEMRRMTKLPATSTYASHRLRVLNKILQLLSIQRTTSQDVELELLFSGLSLAENQSHGFLHGWTKVVSHLVRNVEKTCNLCNAKM